MAKAKTGLKAKLAKKTLKVTKAIKKAPAKKVSKKGPKSSLTTKTVSYYSNQKDFFLMDRKYEKW